MKDKIDNFVSDIAEDKREIAISLKELASEISSDATADIKWDTLCFFKGNRAFVGIKAYKNYVSVIFDRGSELKDDEHFLEGAGKNMRHIKIYAAEDIRNKRVKHYIEQSFSL